MTQSDLEQLALALGRTLTRLGWQVAVAESCTGGWAAQALTSISGSSVWFDRGFVTYSNQAKQEMLGVTLETLRHFGAVSPETVKDMAEGAVKHSGAQVAFAISGIAGPTGGSDSKPVGTVCFAWCLPGKDTETATLIFPGDRTQVRAQAVAYAFRRMQERLAAVQ